MLDMPRMPAEIFDDCGKTVTADEISSLLAEFSAPPAAVEQPAPTAAGDDAATTTAAEPPAPPTTAGDDDDGGHTAPPVDAPPADAPPPVDAPTPADAPPTADAPPADAPPPPVEVTFPQFLGMMAQVESRGVLGDMNAILSNPAALFQGVSLPSLF